MIAKSPVANSIFEFFILLSLLLIHGARSVWLIRMSS